MALLCPGCAEAGLHTIVQPGPSVRVTISCRHLEDQGEARGVLRYCDAVLQPGEYRQVVVLVHEIDDNNHV